MKKTEIIFLILFCLIALSLGRSFIELQKQKNDIENLEKSISAINTNIEKINANIADIEKILSEIQETENEIVYLIASEKTGCPVWVLRGLQFAESSYGLNCDHPDPFDKGEFGLHETPAIRAERVRKWGWYDAENKVQAATIAGYIIMENLSVMGDMNSAISAYRRGVTGTRKNGIDLQYVDKVKSGGKLG